MVQTKFSINTVVQTSSRSELRALLTASGVKLTLPQAQEIIAHAESLGAKTAFRLGVIHTYTSDLLDPWLTFEAALQGLDIHIYHAPYGITFQEASQNSGLVQHKPDMTLFLLRREDLHPDLAYPLTRLSPAQQDELRNESIAGLISLVAQFREYAVGQIVLTLLPPLNPPGLGVFDAQSERSEAAWWAKLKMEVAARIGASLSSCLFVDLDEVALQIGRNNFFDHRFWYSSRFPFKTEAAQEIARRVVGLGAVIKFPKAKVIVLDADNTLWGASSVRMGCWVLR